MAKKTANKRYIFFHQIPSNQNNKKKTFKQWWKWIKIILYVSIFGITLSGCIQGFIIPTSTVVGSGTELQLNLKELPQISTKKVTIKETGKKTDGDLNNYAVSIKNTTENIFIDKKLLNKIQNQFQNNGDKTLNKVVSGVKTTGLILKNKFSSDGKIVEIVDKNLKDQIVMYNNKYLVNLEKTFNKKHHVAFYKNIYDSYDEIYYLSTNNDVLKNIVVERIGDFESQIFDPAKKNDNVALFKRVGDKYNFADGFSFRKPDGKTVDRLKPTFTTLNIKPSDLTDSSINALKFTKDILQTIYKQTILDNPTYKGIPKLIKESMNNNKKVFSKIEGQKIFSYTKSVASLIKYVKLTYDLKDHTMKMGAPQLINTPPNALTIINSYGTAWSYGPFYGLIVYPLYALTQSIFNGTKRAGGFGVIITIFLAVWIVRIISFALTIKATFNQEHMAALAPKKAQIDAKYAHYGKDKETKQKKQQEINTLYKKNNINQFASLTSIVFTLPLFFAMFRIIQGIAQIKSTVFLGVNFAATSWQEIYYSLQWQYIPILIVTTVLQLTSQILPRILRKKNDNLRMNVAEKQQLKKNNKVQNIMLVIFVIFAVAFSAGIQVYWIVGSLYTITQTLGMYYFKKTKYYRQKFRY